MSVLEDTAIFAAIVQQGGFSHAAKHLGLSNGLISRRMALLEEKLGVTLIKRTTRQISLTTEGEIFFKHAQRIQQELNSALSLIQVSVKKPKGMIRVSAPVHFGRHYLSPIIKNFLADYNEIGIELVLTGEVLDPIKAHLDLAIRGVGFLNEAKLRDNGLKARLLVREKIGLYASPAYLYEHGQPVAPTDLIKHMFINYLDKCRVGEKIHLNYFNQKEENSVELKARINCNDIETNLITCIEGYGIARFTDLNVKHALAQKQLRPILQDYDWGNYHLYAVYSQLQALPGRTRLLLEFIAASLAVINEGLLHKNMVKS